MDKQESQFTVASILDLYTKSIKSEFDKAILAIEGFYFKNGDKQYSEYYYDYLHDENKKHKITIYIHSKYRKALIHGQYYRFHGYLNRYDRKSTNGSFQLIYSITKVVDQIDEHQFISKEEFDLVRGRFDRDPVNIKGLLLDILRKNERPRISIIMGRTSIIGEDYKNEMNGCECFDIREQRVSFNNTDELVKAFKETRDSTDLLVCMRGGGNGLEVFNSTDLAKEALKLKVPFATAIGHKKDITMLERVSDRGFSTPTSFGVFLKTVENSYKNEIALLSQKDTELRVLNLKIIELRENEKKSADNHMEDKKQLETIFNLQKEKDALWIKRLALSFVCALALLILTLFLLFR